MRIARIVQHFQPKFGYADYYLMNEFKKHGHEVCIITSDCYSPNIRFFDNFINLKVSSGKFIENGIVVYRLPTLLKVDKVIISLATRKALEDFRPNIVHSNDLFYLTTLFSAYYKKKFKYKLFADSITGTFNPNKLNILLFNFYKLLFTQYLRKNVDGFFAICEGSKKWLSKNFSIPPSSINIVPLGADDKLFIPDFKTRQLMRRNLRILDDEIVLMYSGKILPEKDVDILVKSVVILPREFLRKIKIIIIGNGPGNYLEYLNSLIKMNDMCQNVIIIPTVDRSELPKYYNTADIAIWPGAPSISIIEAMSTGLPIIIAGYPRPREDAYDTTHLLAYRNGLSFQRGNISQLSSCIMKLVLDEQLRKEMGRRSRKLVEEKLNWHKIAKQYLKIYEGSLTS